MLQRLESGADSYQASEYRSVQSYWDDATSTTEAVRELTVDAGLSAMADMRVKKRHRMDVLSDLVGGACSGYILGRFLLGTSRARPTYRIPQAESKAALSALGRRSEEYGWDDVMGAVRGPVADLMVGAAALGQAVNRVLGQRAGQAACLTMQITGIGIVLAEEELFGPLATDGAVPG